MHRNCVWALVLVSACSKGSPQNSVEASASATSATLQSAQPAAAPSASVVSQASWYVGTWKGEFLAARHPSTTTTKEGGPAAWEKDNGQKFTGAGTLEVAVAPNGVATGTAKGALGELGLRGQIDGEELRVNLVAHSDDAADIHNGTLVLKRESDSLKGHLLAGSGDALAMRQADVTLKKATP